EKNVVGVRILPTFAAKGGAFFAVAVGVMGLMGGLFQINPIWNFGPYNPAHISAGSQPDWYMGFTDGMPRLWPPWELHLGNYLVPQVFWPTAAFIPVPFVLAMVYPALERRFTGDNAIHNLLQRPRDVPVRTSLGVMAITFYFWLLLASGNDIVADNFNISLNAMTWIGRIGMLVLPPLAYWVTYRLCLGLQRSDRAVLEHGIETGTIKRLAHGEFIEVHQPLGGVDGHGHAVPLAYQGAAVPKRMNQLGSSGHPVAGSLLRPDPAEQTAALDRARAEESTEGDGVVDERRAAPSERELVGRPSQATD
ncbi:MAG TPA: cytochrome b, partial [Pseudonocardia sp.]